MEGGHSQIPASATPPFPTTTATTTTTRLLPHHYHTSLQSLLQDRSLGKIKSPHVFWNGLAALKHRNFFLSEQEQVASAHQLGIESLHMDRTEGGRFLLAASRDATVSIYDFSKWGSQHYLQGKTAVGDGQRQQQRRRHAVYPSIARSVASRTDAIVEAQWYPVDTGAFVTASQQGRLSVWDTNTMTPVMDYNSTLRSSCHCMQLSTSLGRSRNLVAMGSKTIASTETGGGGNSSIKLVDVQSGATSHSLVLGNRAGTTALHWSPLCDVVLASGSTDGTIRLWDIRKSGRRSCLIVLDRDDDQGISSLTETASGHFCPSYSHLTVNSNHNHSTTSSSHHSTAATSHDGSVTALSFTPDGLFLVSTGTDGRLQVWDLRWNGGHLVPRSFSFGRRGQPPVPRGGLQQQRLPLLVRSYGSETLVWVGHGSRILGYSLQRGGSPQYALEGHMLMVQALDSIDGSLQLVSGAKDGMVLVWDSKWRTQEDERRSSSSMDRNGRKRSAQQAELNDDRDSW